MENKTITWTALEFKTQSKNTLWYLVFSFVAVGLIAYGWFSHNFLTLLTFVVLLGALYLFSHQKPQAVEYELTTTNLRVGKSTYPYRNVKKFWIIYTPENKTVNFETTAYLNNQITLQLGKQDPLSVKQFLKNYLQEDLDKEESFTEVLARKIKF